jgi:hypothetical protein
VARHEGAVASGARKIAMAIHAAFAVPRTHWGKLRVQIGDPSLPTTVTGPARLIALFHWRRGKALPGIWIIEHAAVSASLRVEDIDWALFPTSEAQREMMAHEERCARHVPRRFAPS